MTSRSNDSDDFILDQTDSDDFILGSDDFILDQTVVMTSF